MKKFAYILAFLSAPVLSGNSSGVNSGASMTSGPGLSHYSIFSAANNPAMAPLMVRDDEKWRLTYFPSFSYGVEIGDVNNFADDLDELIDIIDDPNSTDDSATEVLDRFNGVLVAMGEEGYVKNSVSVHAPITPLYFKSEALGGTFFADVHVDVMAAVRILDEELALAQNGESFTTDTSIYLKSGIAKKVSFGYGREILADNKKLFSKGKLYFGAKLNLINLELSKQVLRIEDLDGEEVSDVVRDRYDDNLESTTGFGIDLGLVWDAEWYRIGLNLENLNSPSFDYGDVGVNCGNITNDQIALNSCLISEYFINQGRISQSEEHEMSALARLDGLVKLTDQWFVTSSLELAEYDDVVGFENQWWHLSTAWESGGGFVPSVRVGYQQNLAGSELSSYTFGISFFKVMSFDIEYGTSTIEADGESAPQRFGFSLAFEEKF